MKNLVKNQKKKPYSDRRWYEPMGGKVTGHSEVSKEEQQKARNDLMRVFKVKLPPVE